MRRLPLLLLIPVLAGADEIANNAAQVLRDNCTACHGAGKMSGLDVRDRESMLTGGKRGAAITPGSADKSILYRFAARLDQPSMPPGKKLAQSDLDVLRKWIDGGAAQGEVA